jgi:phospholipase D
MEVYFSPRGGCAARIEDMIVQAVTTIHLAIYDCNDMAIVTQLIAAHTRGVDVQVIMSHDEAAANRTALAALLTAAVPTKQDAVEKIMHNKFLIVDAIHIATGSYNYSYAAEAENAENLIVFDDAAIASQYLANFAFHWSHSS